MLARQVFGNDPIGRRFEWGFDEAPFQVIGVVGDERHVGIEFKATPSFSLGTGKCRRRDPSIIVRTSGRPAAAQSAIASLLGLWGGPCRTLSAAEDGGRD